MFTHIVFYRLKDKKKDAVLLREKFLSMPGLIPYLKKVKVGIDEIRSERSMDVCLYTEFETKSDYLSYRDHPEHLKIAEYVASVKTESYSVDFGE